MTRRTCLLLVAGLGLLVSFGSHRALADDRGTAHLFPPTTLLYAELNDPAQLAGLVLDHPLRQRFEALDGVQQAYQEKQFLQFKAGLAVIEAQLGRPWPKLLADAAGGGAAVGFDAQSQGAALILKARDDATPRDLIATVVGLARQDAENKGNPDPIKTAEYRGIQAYQIGQAKVAVSGPWLVITNKPETGKALLDNILDKPDATLAGDEQFCAARDAAPSGAAAWGYVNLAAIRKAGVAKELFKGQADNPLAELLVGGILANLQKTPFATAAVVATPRELRLELAAPHDRAWVGESRHYYFGQDGRGRAPAVLRTGDTIFSASAYRDVSQMWLRAGDLFDDRVNDQLAAADSNLSTLFSGKDFGEDILGAVRPEAQLVVVRQKFAKDQPQPAIKLPAFALSLRLKDPEVMQTEMRRTFQSLIGFLNVVGAMNGQPQLDLDMEKEGDLQIVAASYVPEQDADPQRLKINFNFSPAVAFRGDRFIVASTRPLARELVSAQSGEENGKPDAEAANTAAVVDFRLLREILSDNRGQLVAQNMLEEGHTKEEAEAEIGVLLELLGFVRSASLNLAAGDEKLSLGLRLQMDTSDTP